MSRNKEIFCEDCPAGFKNFFSNLDKADLQYLNEEKTSKSFWKGQLIFEEGHKALHIYCVRDGKIKVFRNGQDGRNLPRSACLPAALCTNEKRPEAMAWHRYPAFSPGTHCLLVPGRVRPH